MNVYITASGPHFFPQAVKTDSTRGRGGKKVFLEEVKLYCTQSRQTKTCSIPLPQSLHFFFFFLLLFKKPVEYHTYQPSSDCLSRHTYGGEN